MLGGLPPVTDVPAAEIAARIAGGPRLVVLDDDPTGTQTVADVPVLTSWRVDDLRWALRQDSGALFALTNRSLAPEAAAERNRQVVRALHAAATAEGRAALRDWCVVAEQRDLITFSNGVSTRAR